MWLYIFFTSFLVFLTHWLFIKPYGYWRKRNVPHPKPNFLLGNLTEAVLLRKNFGQLYSDIYNDEKYKNLSYVGYYKCRKPGIILRDMELVKNVIVKDFASFHDNDLHVDEKLDPLFSRNPFALTGQKWKETRSLITSGITTSKIKNMLYLMTNVCKNMIEYLENEPDATNKNGLEAKELAARYTTDVVASCAFGLESNCFREPNSVFQQMGKDFISPSFWTGVKHMMLFIMPPLVKVLNVRLVPVHVHNWFTATIKETLRYRETNNINRNDYLDMLISLREKTQGKFAEIDIVAQALTFYADGFETSSNIISFILYELAENPDIQRKVQNEVDTVLAKYNGEITYEAMQEITYLDNIISEGLRKHQPVLFMSRLCTKPFELPPPQGEGTGPNITIEVGTPVITPILAIHHDPKIYENPEKFDPDRFTEENKQKRPKYSFLSFGEGPRICLGSKFGLAQTKAALIAIISNFEIKPNPKIQSPLKMDPQFFMNAPKGGIWLNFIKRKK